MDADAPTLPLRRAAASAASLHSAAAASAAPPPTPPDSSGTASPAGSSDQDYSPAGKGGGGGLKPAPEAAPLLPFAGSGAALLRAPRRSHRPTPHGAARRRVTRRIALACSCVLLAAACITLTISRPWMAAAWTLREAGPVLRAGREWGSPAVPPGSTERGAPLPPSPPPPSRIPRIVHQTWRGPAASLPPAWARARDRCAALHPGWTLKLWSDADARALVARAAPSLLPTYDAYPDAIQRADMMRYVALWAEGGVYLDLDVECRAPMDGLLTPPGRLDVDAAAAKNGSSGPPASIPPPSAILPITWPVSLSNDVMAAEPGSPLMAALIAAAPAAAARTQRWPRYARVMFSTGPMFVTGVATRLASQYRTGHPRAGALFGVLPAELYGKYGPHGVRLGGEEEVGGPGRPASTPPLFAHLHGSSWHGSDAAAAIWAAHHGWALGGYGFALGVAVLSGAAGAYYARSVRRARAATAAAPAVAKMC